MSAPRCFGIASKFEQRSGAGTEEQIVEQPLVLEDEGGEPTLGEVGMPVTREDRHVQPSPEDISLN